MRTARPRLLAIELGDRTHTDARCDVCTRERAIQFCNQEPRDGSSVTKLLVHRALGTRGASDDDGNGAAAEAAQRSRSEHESYAHGTASRGARSWARAEASRDGGIALGTEPGQRDRATPGATERTAELLFDDHDGAAMRRRRQLVPIARLRRSLRRQVARGGHAHARRARLGAVVVVYAVAGSLVALEAFVRNDQREVVLAANIVA